MAATLEVEQVSKSYQGRPAVRELSFSVQPGRILGFLGPNGAGKTTTLRMILGVARPDSGSVRLFGGPVTPAARDRVGFLPEERGLYRKMRAADIITFFARLRGMPAGAARARGRELLEQFGLGDAANKKVSQLSKGMAQKVQIISAIAHDPDLVIFDEPFSGLDPVNQQGLEELVRSLRDRGATVLFSTHVMQHAERLCDDVVVIAKGRKVFDGTVRAALARVPRRARIELGAGFDPAPHAPPGVRLQKVGEADGAARWEADLAEGAAAQELLTRLVAAAAPLRAFEPVQAHLHDVFVRLVSDAEAEDAARAAAATPPGGTL